MRTLKALLIIGLFYQPSFAEVGTEVFPSGANELKSIILSPGMSNSNQNVINLRGSFSCYGVNFRAVHIPLKATSDIVVQMSLVKDKTEYTRSKNQIAGKIQTSFINEKTTPTLCAFTPVELSYIRSLSQFALTSLISKMITSLDGQTRNKLYFESFGAYYNHVFNGVGSNASNASILSCIKVLYDDQYQKLGKIQDIKRVKFSIPAQHFRGNSNKAPKIEDSETEPRKKAKMTSFKGRGNLLNIAIQIPITEKTFFGSANGAYAIDDIKYDVQDFAVYQNNANSVGSYIEGSYSAIASADGTINVKGSFPGEMNFCGSFVSPLMLFFDNKRPSFRGQSHFPLDPYGNEIYWVEKNHPGYFLAKRSITDNLNPTSDELFGNQNSVSGNGFEALRDYDTNKDNLIDNKDKSFEDLVLWKDSNGDGIAQKSEVSELQIRNVSRISLKYETKQIDAQGSRAELRETASFSYLKDGKATKGQVIDVWFNLTR